MAIDPGKRAEYIFAAEVLERNLVPCWPSSAQYPFDLVVASRLRAVRVQIKASSKGGVGVTVGTHNRSGKMTKVYSPQEVDYLAIYLSQFNLWYVIPTKQVQVKGIRLRPEDPTCPFAKYKGAFKLLES